MHLDDIMKQAKAGNPRAQFELGFCFAKGHGLPQDPQQSFFWYKQAAENNYPKAFYNLGNCYDRGFGVEQDREKAYELFLKAAWVAIPQAQYNVASLLVRQSPPDFKESLIWLLLAQAGGLEAAKERIEALRHKFREDEHTTKEIQDLFTERFAQIYGDSFFSLLQQQDLSLPSQTEFDPLSSFLEPTPDDHTP